MTTALTSVSQFLELLRQSGLVEDAHLAEELRKLAAPSGLPETAAELSAAMVRNGLLTNFQSNQLLQGKSKGFVINDRYKVLEVLGAGGMGKVYLCEHILLKRLVALKVLPFDQVDKPSALERFYREARALAALDHPNIVRAHDMDRDRKLHFLVMEYVDGASLQELVSAVGPLEETRAAHYISQAALGLQHAHEAGWVHRDIKPGNILVDRLGTVKILDMGLALLFQDTTDGLTKMYDDQCVLGTADYLSPEQGMDSHDVDIRSDIYSLGATLYFTLTGKPPFDDSTSLTRKLLQHQMQEPRPLREARPDVSREMAAVVARMMAKDPARRYQVPLDVVDALAAWTQTPVAPLDLSMTKHCTAVQNLILANPRPAVSETGMKAVNGPLLARPVAPRTPPPRGTRTPPPRTPSPRTPPPRGPRTPPRAQPREVIPTAEEETILQAEAMPTAKLIKGPRSGKKRVQPPGDAYNALLGYLPGPVQRNWPTYAGAGVVALACVIVMVVLWAARKHGASPESSPVQGVVQTPDAAPPVEHPPLITLAEAENYLNQRCTIEMLVKAVRPSRDVGVILDSETDVPVVLRKDIVTQYEKAGHHDLKDYLGGKTIRLIGRVTLTGNRLTVEAERMNQIWFSTPSGTIKPDEAVRYVNVKCDVEMLVRSTGQDKDATLVFLNSESDYRIRENFTVVIPRAVAEKYKERGLPDPATHFYQKTIRVSGQVTLVRGRPQIQIQAPDQIRLVK
jgi:serine/threonine protein kinase